MSIHSKDKTGYCLIELSKLTATKIPNPMIRMIPMKPKNPLVNGHVVHTLKVAGRVKRQVHPSSNWRYDTRNFNILHQIYSIGTVSLLLFANCISFSSRLGFPGSLCHCISSFPGLKCRAMEMAKFQFVPT